ncbi:ABC transporter substrate-binding protein [Bacillus sp. AFS076308]|uniref:extracellular solute-binding protein n=1 Tax=unclassified Bacillus (in: firmicutes) TaxID=185979 RepID=UPI000BF43D39|nr:MULTISPECIES: extracellular solute-binding protein [unclassified Bacillus (in: firmicutes)]PFN97333.1 ABC transporter substrate-binding protein [Bacillus sp. AFS076308]PGV51762.1 ABC transporter substrate-binding protein [Bacillus sp. AFS037270]
MSLVMLAALALAGCSSSSSSSEESASSGGKKVIKFMHLWPEGSSNAQFSIVKNIISDYEKQHKDVKIETEILSPDQYRDKLKVLASSNELPDIGMTWSDGFIKPYVEGDMLEPLDDVVNNDPDLKDAFIPGVKESYAVDGKTYGLPLELNISYVFYNKEIFKKYNLEVPKTFEEYKNVVKTLAKNGVTPATVGAKDGWPASFWFMYLADRIGGPTILTDVIHGKAKMTDPAIVKAGQEVQNLVDMGGFEKGASALSNEDAKGYFMNEKAAMFLTATWELPNYTTSPDVKQDFKDKIGYFKFPTYEGGKGTDINSYVGGPGVGLFVAKDSKVKKEAKDFVGFLVKEWGKKSVTDAGVIPATKVDTSSLKLSPMYIDILKDLSEASNVTTYFDTQSSPAVSELHHDLMTALFGKQITPKDFAKQQADALAKEQK